MSKPEFQYVTELHHHDVVLGRGSGPNDRQGNINFRSLCNDKKIAYIEAKSRDEKGRIAADIVATVHNRGGRFLKRLTAEQAKKADVQLRGADAVYELADKKTILEKTKQTLRQNRADFVAKVEKEVGRAPVVGAYPIHQRKNDDDDDKQPKEEVKSNCGVTTDDNTLKNIDPISLGEACGLDSINRPTTEKNCGVAACNNNIDPIPLGESCGLDSMNRPTMGRNSATLLLAALFNSSELQPIMNRAQESFYESAQSGVSAMSIQDMSLLLCDAMDRQSSGSEMDSANMFQSILNECSVNDDMADQLVDELVKDTKSQQGTFNWTNQQKALLLQYEQDRQRTQEQQQVQEGRLQQQQQQQQQQQARHPLRQFRQGGDNDSIAPSSVFSSLVRHYKNDDDNNYDDELNQLSCLHEAFFENDSDRTIRRGHRTSLSGGDPIEPANYMDESMDISYQAARDLNQALGGSSLTTLNRVANSSEKRNSSSSSSKITYGRRRVNSFDSSFNESMMSMSISDFDQVPGSLPTLAREGSKGTPNEVKVRNHSGVSSLFVSDFIAETEEDFNL